MRTFIVLAFAAMLLAGCVKTNDKGESEVALPGGQKMVMGKTLPADAPSYVKAWPGAEMVTRMEMKGVGTLVAFPAKGAKADEVLAFYRNTAGASGLVEVPVSAEQASSFQGQKVVMFNERGRDKFMLVSVRDQGADSVVSLVYGTMTKEAS
jgi:hypothetical protein